MIPEDDATELMPDALPKSGMWVETCDVLPEPTDDELAEGEADGEWVSYEGDDEEPTDV